MINHLSVKQISQAGVFNGIANYDQLIDAIKNYGGNSSSEEYNDRVGAAWEVFTEFFLKRYSGQNNPHFSVNNVKDTSQNKYQVGYDFTYSDRDGNRGLAQSKFRSNITHKFTRVELGTYASIADEEGIPSDRRILFTNLEHQPSNSSNGIFENHYAGGLKQFRVIGRIEQESFILRDSTFWTELATDVNSSASPVSTKQAPPLRPHQIVMLDGAERVMKLEIPRGRIICATGGGKTLVEYQVIRDGFFKHDLKLQIVVAPTIDLLRQHHTTFQDIGMFHNDNVKVIHFRTGDEARTDDHIDYVQTTNEDDLLDALKKNENDKTLIFVTYASEVKMLNIFKKNELTADTAVWDEFHHAVRQNEQSGYRDHILMLPIHRNLFFSASEKCGRIMSSTDEELFGEKLAEVSFSELVQQGILVPRVLIKPIRLNPDSRRLKPIARDMKKAAQQEKFDAKVATMEAASICVARADLLKHYARCNAVTFSKQVAICKAIVYSSAVRNELQNALLQTVHAGVPGNDRKNCYDKVKVSDDSILAQYSVVKEGIDITPFNAVIFSRKMDIIGTQQGLGRIVRADPRDTENLKNGTITLDSPVGWHKYYAIIYVVIHDDELGGFEEFVKEFVGKLFSAGLTEDDFQFAEISEERSGKEIDENGWISPIPINNQDLISSETLQSYVKNLVVKMEKEAKYLQGCEEAKKLSNLELF
jgi:superfamily II DNA or RNA helicase